MRQYRCLRTIPTHDMHVEYLREGFTQSIYAGYLRRPSSERKTRIFSSAQIGGSEKSSKMRVGLSCRDSARLSGKFCHSSGPVHSMVISLSRVSPGVSMERERGDGQVGALYTAQTLAE
jgi:hypothetical protein